MKAILICPSDRDCAGVFSRRQPPALLPMLGRTALDWAMSDLARRGAKEIIVLAADRPVMIRSALAGGKAWGVKVEVVSEPRELTSDEARAKYKSSDEGWIAAPHDVITIEGWPNSEGLWHSPQDWFASLGAHLDEAASANVGMRQFKPGVWLNTKARVSPTAVLNAPCWIGHQAWIGPNAIIGPDAYIENGACIDANAEVVSSHVAPKTYVGSDVELRDSLAYGSTLFNWRSHSQVEITDGFLLGDMTLNVGRNSGGLLGRLFALLTLLLMLPIIVVTYLRNKLSGERTLIRHRTLLAPETGDIESARTFIRYELNGVHGMWRRLPELWNVLRGECAWIGNRPLSVTEAASLETEFERLWLSVPCGVFALSDLYDDGGTHMEAASPHAAYYAAHHGFNENVRILRGALSRLFVPNRAEIKITTTAEPHALTSKDITPQAT